jgi:SAM-dependent methyltransferase
MPPSTDIGPTSDRSDVILEWYGLTMSIVPNTSHYTPEAMARRIAEGGILPLLRAGLWPCQVLVFDPACGDGALLLAATEVLINASQRTGYGERSQFGQYVSGPELDRDELAHTIITNNLCGNDIDECSVDRAQVAFHDRFDSAPDLYYEDALRVRWTLKAAPFDNPNCILLNPPYLGGGKISHVLGTEYRDFLKTRVSGAHGNADLSAYFLRLAGELCPGGQPETIAFVATNTICQGDTRIVGLYPLILDEGWDVRWASTNEQWPGKANLSVRVATLSRGLPPTHTSRIASYFRGIPSVEP